MRSTSLRALIVCAALAGVLIQGDTLRAVSTTVLISEFRVRGPNGAADEFVELFNVSASPVNIGGWKINGSNNAAGTSTRVTIPANVMLGPGCFYLITNSSTTGGPYSGAVPGNLTFSVGITDDGGIGLLDGANVAIDQVGMSLGSAYKEGTTLASLGTSNLNRGYERKPGGTAGNGTDTDNNASDFQLITPSNPQNASSTCITSGDSAPSVSSTTPAAGETNVSVNSTIVINFSESVTATDSAFSLACPAGSPRTFTQTASPAASFTLTPTLPLPPGTTCDVKVTASQVTDTDATDPPDTMASDHDFSFSTASSADTAPFVFSTTPANGTLNVPVASPIVIGLSESVTASPTAFSIQCPAGSPQVFGQSAGPDTTYTLTPSAPLPYSTTCTVSIAADQISDTDANDPPDGMASNAAFSFTTAAAPPPGAGIVMINELDADTPGSDMAEFVELYDGGVGNTLLDGLVVVFFEGGTGTGTQSYAAFDLDGHSTDANGYFTMGNPGVPGVSLVFEPGEFGLLSNGPDAVALYIGSASDFPNGTVRTTTNLQDAIVYGTDDPNASGLLPLLNAGQKIVNENATGNEETQSSQRCPSGMGGFRNTSPYYPGAPTPGTVNVCPPPRPPSDVVISQIYGGGGNNSATYQNDFVELYNRGAGPVDLTGWSLQYASATGSGWDSNRQPLGGSIGAGQYYLIALASGTVGDGAALPPANIEGQINMSATSGKLALVASFTGLVGGCPIYDAAIKDFVGYGSADCGEGSTTTQAGSNTTALFRKNDGHLDTDNNANDFAAPAIPNPRQTAPIVELGPNVLTTDPRFNGINAPRDATIQVTFTETVDVDAVWFTLTCASSGQHHSATFAVSFGGRDHYITPNDNFIAGEQCSVTILGNRIHDKDLDDSGANTDTLPADYSWSFTVATGAAPPYPSSVHVAMGNPTTAGSDPSNYLMDKPEFTLSYNRDLGRPNWVSWHLSDEWIGTLARVDTFRPDPAIPPEWYRVQSFDFAGSGFDRGHVVPNADRDKETSIPINQATFLMSNMVAQAPGNNQGPWAAFEEYLRTLVTAGSEIYIVSGPAGVGGSGSNRDQNNQPFVTTTLADGHVTVPAWTWKVALVLTKDNGDDLSRVTCSTRTIAVIMPNLDTIRPNAWETYLTTVDAVETLTGYELFSNLPAPYQQCIEAGTNGNNPPLVKGDQTIAFAQPPDSTYGDAPITVSATGGASGNPVTFAASGSCTSSGFHGATITILAAGSCTVTASQAGSDIYNAAEDVARTFTVHKATPAFSALSSPTIEAGSASTVVGGVLTLGTLAPTGSVAVTLDGVTVNAPIAANGQFSATFATGSLSVANNPYAISFGYGGDTNFNGATGSSSLTVADTTPPAITGLTVDPSVLVPANHKMRLVTLTYQTSDNGPPPTVVLSVSSSEPVNGTGDGDTAPDWELVDATHVLLRAERSGNGTGRLYTIRVAATDASGNITIAEIVVAVPY